MPYSNNITKTSQKRTKTWNHETYAAVVL